MAQSKLANNKNSKGSLEVICGSMFSGKTDELIRQMVRAQFAQLNTIIFKHTLDNRKTIEYIHAHNGKKLKAVAVENPKNILDLIFEDIDVIGIDEIQFFDQSIINVVLELIERGKRVIVAGLDLDFRGNPFGALPALLAIANSVKKLSAVCIKCGNDAHFSQRLVNGKPASYADPLIMAGAEEHYQARCRNCYKIDKMPQFEINTVTL